MFELMVSSGNKSKVDFPDSGPGSKTLRFGSEKLGYFASVPVSEFFSATELRKQLNFQLGTDNNNNPLNWVKAMFQGKVLFFPQFPFAVGLSWNQLYAAGLVYGEDGPGKFPAASGAVNQFKLVNIGSDVFKVRLFSIILPTVDDGYWGVGSTAPLAGNSPWVSESEWSSMCQSLIQGVASNYAGPKWSVYPNSSFLASGRTAVMRETCSNPASATLGSNVQLASALKTASGWWYPVLELIPGDQRPLLPMNGIENTVRGIPTPMAVDEIIQDVGLVKYRQRYSRVVFIPPNPNVDGIDYVGFNKIKRTDIRVITTEQSQPVIDEITYS